MPVQAVTSANTSDGGGGIRPGDSSGLITEVTIDDSSWTALPSNPLSGRISVSVQNRSGQEIKINFDNSEPDYVGIAVDDGGDRHYDVTDNIIFYGKSSSGSVVITVEEIA